MDTVQVQMVAEMSNQGENMHIVDRLIAEADAGGSASESATLSRARLDEAELRAAATYALTHIDRSAYLLLLALRRQAPEMYQGLPAAARAGILCAALAHQGFLNDWGYLDPKESFDGEAAVALLELGADAIAPLRKLLDDGREARLFGSETATLSRLYGYRRNDFAYRYLALIRGETPQFDPSPAARDQEIERLKKSFPSEEIAGEGCDE